MTSQVCWLVTLARYVAPEPADSQSLQPSNKKRKKMHPAFTLSVWCQSHVYPWAFILHSSIALQTSAHVYMEAKGAQRFWQHGLPHAGWRSWGWSFFTCIILWPWKASSHFLCFLQILSEALSVKKSSEIATAFREDGLVGDAINNFGKPAQERDFFRWTLVWPCWYVALLSFRHHVAMHILTCARIRLPIKPYTATNLGSLRSFFVLMKMFSTLTLVLSFDSRIPILCTVGLEKKETMCEVSFVLPSDILSYILGQDDIVAKNCLFEDGPDAIGDYWGKEMPSHKARLGLSDEELATCVPLWFHEDGVPHWHSDSQPCCVMCHFHNCEFSGLRCRTWNLTVTFKLCLWTWTNLHVGFGDTFAL